MLPPGSVLRWKTKLRGDSSTVALRHFPGFWFACSAGGNSRPLFSSPPRLVWFRLDRFFRDSFQMMSILGMHESFTLRFSIKPPFEFLRFGERERTITRPILSKWCWSLVWTNLSPFDFQLNDHSNFYIFEFLRSKKRERENSSDLEKFVSSKFFISLDDDFSHSRLFFPC